MSSKYINREAVVKMLREKALSMLLDTDDEAQYQVHAYERAADLVETYNSALDEESGEEV